MWRSKLTTLDEYNRLWNGSAILPDMGIGLVELFGSDAQEWLQGQATNDLRILHIGPISFCLCEPTGQMLAICQIWKKDGRLLIASDNVAALMNRVENMVILEDVQARDLSNEYQLASIQGPGTTKHLDEVIQDGAIILANIRLGTFGFDIWLPKSAQRPDSISDDAFEIARIEAGIPKRNVDYNSRTLPPELGRQFELDHVSYNKGCYTGQEVLMRIHSRGHTNRTWMGVILEGQVEVGATISHESREDAGVITSAALSPEFGYIATAMLRREVAKTDTKISVKGVAGRCMLLPIRAL